MNLDSHKPDIAIQLKQVHLDWADKFYYTSSSPEFQADTWVQILELPSTFSHDEALLLCQLSKDEWLAWIPGHGEAELHTSQFCALACEEI